MAQEFFSANFLTPVTRVLHKVALFMSAADTLAVDLSLVFKFPIQNQCSSISQTAITYSSVIFVFLKTVEQYTPCAYRYTIASTSMCIAVQI